MKEVCCKFCLKLIDIRFRALYIDCKGENAHELVSYIKWKRLDNIQFYNNDVTLMILLMCNFDYKNY